MLRRYFFSGLLFWVPLWITWAVLSFVVGLLDETFSSLPQHYQPDYLLGFHLPGLGLLFTLLIIFLTGVLLTNFVGRRLVHLWESLLTRIPLVRSIYSGVKQITQTMLSPSTQSFRKVVLIQFPHQQAWTLAFLTNSGLAEAQTKLGHELIAVFVPTTPNPTGGYFLFVPKQNAIELSLSVDEALKMIISMGVVAPPAAVLAPVPDKGAAA